MGLTQSSYSQCLLPFPSFLTFVERGGRVGGTHSVLLTVHATLHFVFLNICRERRQGGWDSLSPPTHSVCYPSLVS